MLLETLDLMTTGVLLVDKAGRLVHTHAAAAKLLDENRALRRDGEYFSAHNPGTSKHIRDAITRAADGGSAAIGSTGIALSIPAIDGTDLALWFLPIDEGGLRRELAAPFSAQVAIFVRDPAENSSLPGDLSVHRYNIIGGMPLYDDACARHVDKRSCLHSGDSSINSQNASSSPVCKKGVQRQFDLMRLVLSVLAPARLHSN